MIILLVTGKRAEIYVIAIVENSISLLILKYAHYGTVLYKRLGIQHLLLKYFSAPVCKLIGYLSKFALSRLLPFDYNTDKTLGYLHYVYCKTILLLFEN